MSAFCRVRVRVRVKIQPFLFYWRRSRVKDQDEDVIWNTLLLSVKQRDMSLKWWLALCVSVEILCLGLPVSQGLQ